MPLSSFGVNQLMSTGIVLYQTYQLVSCGGGNDLHIRVAVLGNSSDRGRWLVRMCSLDCLRCLARRLHGFVAEVDHVLSSICEELLAKSLEVTVDESQWPCKKWCRWWWLSATDAMVTRCLEPQKLTVSPAEDSDLPPMTQYWCKQ